MVIRDLREGFVERENWLHGEGCLHAFPPAGVAANSQLKVLPYRYFTLGWDQLYPYTADLMCLDSCSSQGLPTPQELWSVTTPLVVPSFERSSRPSICTLHHGRPLPWVSHWLQQEVTSPVSCSKYELCLITFRYNL